VIASGSGTDVVDGGTNDDTIDTSGDPGNKDKVECGTGTDTVTADKDDLVSSDCENVTRV
jgi:hypothetical protein